MDNSILLSPDSYELLKYISSQPNSLVTNVSELSEDCLSQLVHYKLIEEHITIYTNCFPVVSSISITELGKGYLYGRQSNDAFQQSVKDIADSAVKTAGKADVKGWISVLISLAALIWSIVYPLILQGN